MRTADVLLAQTVGLVNDPAYIGRAVLERLGLDADHAECSEIASELYGLWHSWQIDAWQPDATGPGAAQFDQGLIAEIRRHVTSHQLEAAVGAVAVSAPVAQ